MKMREALIGLAVALAIALFLSRFASSLPDGLERVLGDVGMAIQRAEDQTLQMQARASAVDRGGCAFPSTEPILRPSWA